MKLQRLIAILTILLQRDRISATALAEKFEVSVRTIYRDMQTLEEAGIPILTHTGVNGGFSIVDEYKIDKKLFTHQDITTLLTGLQSVSGSLSSATVNSTLEKIRGLIPQGHERIELTSKQLYVDMTPWAQNPLMNQTLALLKQALAQSRLATIEYTGRYSATTRIVEPHQLILKENNWYLRAFCREKQAFRTFRLSRIHGITLLEEPFTLREFENELDDFKQWQHSDMITVTLLLDASHHQRALDFCHPDAIQDLGNGKLHIQMPFVESEMGYGVLLGFGHACEVLSPPHIRQEVARRAKLLTQVYE